MSFLEMIWNLLSIDAVLFFKGTITGKQLAITYWSDFFHKILLFNSTYLPDFIFHTFQVYLFKCIKK